MTMAVGPGCDCGSVHGQGRLRSNHGCLRRRMIKAMAIRGLSPTTRRRVEVQLVFGRCPDRFGLEVAPHLIIAREKCVQSAREAA